MDKRLIDRVTTYNISKVSEEHQNIIFKTRYDKHTLKTNYTYFDAVKKGLKLFELRKHDRDYKVGDQLLLVRYDPDKEEFSEPREEIKVIITYILNDVRFGVKDGYSILGIAIVTHTKFKELECQT